MILHAHQLLVYKSGIFLGAAPNWAIDKEAIPIMWACVYLEYLLLRSRDFRLFCDHKNLIHILDPSVELKRHIQGHLQRWALALAGLPYVIEHLDGDKNDRPNLLSRWGCSASEEGVTATRCKAITRSSARTSMESPVDEDHQLRPRFDGFVFPTLDEIQHAQTEYGRAKPAGAVLNDEQLLVVDGIRWLPETAKDLMRRVMIVAHCGSQGHRGLEPMMQTIQHVLFVRILQKLCRHFLSRRLLCKHTKGGTFVPPTLSYKRFGTPEILMSDTGSYFKNLVVNELCQRQSIEQQFAVAYSPWISGIVERTNHDILMLMEFQLDKR
ncbi:hypothetical protein PR001_g3429 [Phytophthora rubi]|nr:hypothetical protein PR001_g3429 [Phytophthora rubi]